jgi:ribosomal protein S27E
MMGTGTTNTMQKKTDSGKPRCPGSMNIRTPELDVKSCPGCGAPVEIFSDETSARCAGCGTAIYREIESCARWCRYAAECLGEEEYARIMNRPEGRDH